MSHLRKNAPIKIFEAPYGADPESPKSIDRALTALKEQGRLEEYEDILEKEWSLQVNYWSRVSPSTYLDHAQELQTIFVKAVIDRDDINSNLRKVGERLLSALSLWGKKREQAAVLSSLFKRVSSASKFKELEEASEKLDYLEIDPSYIPHTRVIAKMRATLDKKYSLIARGRRRLKTVFRKASTEPTVEGFLFILRGSAIQYDERKSAKDPYHNKYALSHYMRAITNIEGKFTERELKSSDPEVLRELIKEISNSFQILGITNKVIKSIKAYITQGRMPTYPVSRATQKRK